MLGIQTRRQGLAGVAFVTLRDISVKSDQQMMKCSSDNGFARGADEAFPDLRARVFAICSLCAVVAIIYGNSLFGEWHFDDFHNIVDNGNIHLQTLTWEEIRKTFYGVTYGTEKQSISRPLAYFSFGLNYFFGGKEVFGYHLVNVLVHGLGSIVLFLFLYEMLRLPLLRDRYGTIAYPIALLSSFLWVTSPVQVHAVAIVVQRMASMAGLFYILTLYFYLKGRTAIGAKQRILPFTLCTGSAMAAFATQENTAVLPIVLLLFDFFFIQGIKAGSTKKMLKGSILPLALVAGLGLFYMDFSISRAVDADGVRPFSTVERLLTQGRVLLFYVSLLLYPIPSRLTLLHDIEISHSLLDPWTTLPALLTLVLVSIAAIRYARRAPLLSYCVLFFLLNHLIEGTVIPLELIFEHRNYIPSMLFFVPIAIVMIRFLDYFSYNKRFQYFLAGGLALILAFQGHTTFERNNIVRSDLHLWLDNVKKAPNLSRPRINLAKHYYEAGMYDEAYRELKTAEELNRDTNLRQIGLASYNLGVYYLYQAKDLDRAEQQFRKALERFPGHPSAIAGLATVYLQNGDVEHAWDLLKPYASGQIRSTEIANAFALVLLKKGDAGGAIRMAGKSLDLYWNSPQPWEIWGEAWRLLGEWRKAADCWEKALRLNPANPRALLALVELYDRLQDKPALTRTAERCLASKGDAPLEEWLEGFARDSGAAAYAPAPGTLVRIIRKEVCSELMRRKNRSDG